MTRVWSMLPFITGAAVLLPNLIYRIQNWPADLPEESEGVRFRRIILVPVSLGLAAGETVWLVLQVL